MPRRPGVGCPWRGGRLIGQGVPLQHWRIGGMLTNRRAQAAAAAFQLGQHHPSAAIRVSLLARARSLPGGGSPPRAWAAGQRNPRSRSPTKLGAAPERMQRRALAAR